MAISRTATETKQYYIDAMGQQLGSVFYHLWQESAILHLTWNEYRALFDGEEGVKTLNMAARGFFGMVQHSWWEGLLLHLSRMTDNRRDVLSVQRMVKLVQPAIKDSADRLLDAVTLKVSFARDWRDEHIAHRSLERVLNGNATPLPPASSQAMAEAIEALDGLIHLIENHYCHTAPTYYAALTAVGGADSLLFIVESGLKERLARFGG